MSNSIVKEPVAVVMGVHWLFLRLPLSFSLRPPSHMRSSRLELSQRRMACNGLASRERDVKPKGHLTPNDTLGEEE